MQLKPEKEDVDCCSIDRLIAKLNAKSKQASFFERLELIDQHPIDWQDVRKHVFRNPVEYHREKVETNSLFQLLILTWLPGQKSEIHNHRGSHCVVRVLSGMATETIYVPGPNKSFSTKKMSYAVDSTFGGQDDDIHTLENAMEAIQDLITMHVYFPELESMELFAAEDGRLVQSIDC